MFEIQYYLPGIGWKRKAFKTEAAMMKFVDKLVEENSDVQIEYATN